LVETTLDRLGHTATAQDELAMAWDRIQSSMSDPDEVAYCRVAGRLGLDPYDESNPDLTEFAADLNPALFEDISDAAFVEELQVATDWVRDTRKDLSAAPFVDLTSFGEPVPDDLGKPAWKMGALAAEALRKTLDFDDAHPRHELERVMGDVLIAKRSFRETGPPSINVLFKRENGGARVGTIARSAREQRFKACTAAYLAWMGQADTERAATPAFTRRQQAGRAFAAEMLAPQAHLRSQAPAHGFTWDQIEDIASKLVCPHETVAWQAYHAGIPLRGEEALRFGELSLV
jgi:hypothetical protein